nr:lantibiotic dehydratase C-terminal domain-containing protein [Arthrobacter jiangjiafuii]
MSQLIARTGSRRLNDETVWCLLTIQPETREFCDAVVCRIVTPLAAQAQVWGAERWAYTRSLNPAAPSVNFGALAPPAAFDRLRSFAQALVDQSHGEMGAIVISDHPPAPPPTRWGKTTDTPGFEAALAKYGGVEGLHLAAEVCEVSSALAAWALSRFPAVNSRATLASLLLFDTCHAMMSGPHSAGWPDRRGISWDYYWDSHLRSSTGHFGPQAAQRREALIARLAPRTVSAHRLMAATASEPAVENWRKKWSRAIDAYLYRADKERVSRSAQQLTMYQSSELLNRLGFAVPDEATLGLYARSWSKDREADLLQDRP